MDDHGAHQYHADSVPDDLSDAATIPDEDDADTSTTASVDEVRFGVRDTRDSRDVEANLPELIREKSAISVKDPNLVSRLSQPVPVTRKADLPPDNLG